MNVTRKQQYALRAVFELAARQGQGPTKISTIARVQAIPTRFLEVILNKLKHSGLVEAKRGFRGGYTLLANPRSLSVDDVFRSLDDEKEHTQCVACMSDNSCPLGEGCVFMPVWIEVQDAVAGIYKKTMIQDLIETARKTPPP
jgi:Rrf2 family cysteine metabolism transcriptional repressor